jgi:hypothetical protein
MVGFSLDFHATRGAPALVFGLNEAASRPLRDAVAEAVTGF